MNTNDSSMNQREALLETELQSLLEERHFIEVAKIRWIHSDNLIVDSLNYLDVALAKLQQFEDVSNK